MSTAPRQKMTRDEFLTFERAQPERHLLWDGEVFAMAGGTRAHSLLGAAVVAELRAQLGRSGCEVHGGDLRVAVPADNFVYPDASVSCGPQFADAPSDTLLNPLILVEVLSASTEAFDRGKKFRAYTRLPSLRHYVLMSQYEPLVEVFSRPSARADWSLRSLTSGERLTLEPPGCVLDVDALYANVPLSLEPPREM